MVEINRNDVLRNTALVCALAMLSAAVWVGYSVIERSRLAKDPEQIVNRFRMAGGM
jgi:hypothetical protein